MGISPVRRILVYLPTDDANTDERFPTVYWIPGWQGWATEEYRAALDRAIADNVIPRAIIVSVDTREGIVFLNSSLFGNWEDFLVNEVIPFVDRTYPTIPSMRYRALMGHSIGGYAAMILPLRHPGVWGAVGLNDGSVWAASTYLPLWRLPSTFDAYAEIEAIPQVFIQLGIAISPNPAAPLRFDLPWEDGEVPDVARKWEEFSVMRPANLQKHLRTLKSLSVIAVVVPEVVLLTNREQNLEMVRVLRDLGVHVTTLEMPGAHDDYRNERLVALLRTVLPTMFLEMPRAVEAERKAAALWGTLKTER
jgi:pimeloyl-ACP methyl ester carboxylesterase